MKVNNSSLTGESEDLIRIPEEHKENIFESPNVAFFGTMCTNGEGTGLVFKTGDNSVIGQIANLAQSASSGETPIQKEIDHFITFIAKIALFAGVFFFCLNFIYGYGIVTNISFMIGIIVANVPEGLLISVTVCMAIAAARMADKKVLVKNMQSVETLGSATCICSDKTGTLTQNKMTASHIFYDGKTFDISVNYERLAKERDTFIEYNINDPGFKAVMECVALGSKASFKYKPTLEDVKTFIARREHKNPAAYLNTVLDQKVIDDIEQKLIDIEKALPLNERNATGDASEKGLIKFYQGIQDLEKARETFPTFIYEDNGKQTECLIPFNSEIKFNLYIRDMNKGNLNPKRKEDNLMVFLKGAPEKVLSRCSKILINGEERDFDDFWQKEVNEANSSFGNMGERVLAFARMSLDPQVFPKSSYKFDVKGWA